MNAEMNEQHLFEFGESLLKLAVKWTGDFELAEDLVSETFMSALIAVKSGTKIENPKGYLTGILNHKFNDFLRSKYSKPTISYGVIPKFDFESNGEGAQKSADTIGTVSPLDELIKKDEAEKVRRIITQLSKNYREVLVRHYIYGQNVQSIADELLVNANTVKSRLNTARMNVKAEMENEKMEKYEKQSYEPEQLDIWIYGEMESDCTVFYTNNWTRRIQQNILILAYKKPLTITEISKGLGISAAYIEPIVEELISYDFMERTGDKVYTSFIIFTQEEMFKAYDHDKAIAEKYASAIWPVLEEHLEKVRALDCYKKMNERQQASLIQYLAIFIIHEACREIEAEKLGRLETQDVQHKSGWHGYAYGFISPIGYKPDWDYNTGHSLCKLNGCHSVSTCAYKGMDDLRFYGYDVVAGFTWSQWWPLNDLQFLKVCYALYSGKEDDIPLIAPKFFDKDVIERYEKYNFIGREHNDDLQNCSKKATDCGRVVLNIPVIEHEDGVMIHERIIHEALVDIVKKFHSELEELFVNPVSLPKHLNGKVPEYMRYQLCADAYVMALVYQGAWNGWYKAKYPIGHEWVPAMIIVLGKKM